MITWMQRHKKWLIITIWISTIAFIGAGFVGWGQYSYGDKAGAVAKVGDVEISQGELQKAYSRLYTQYNQVFKGNFDEEKAKQFGLQKQALQRLLQQALILNLAKEYDLTVSDKEVIQVLRSQKAFYKNGLFDPELYKQILSQNRLTPTEYEAELKKELLIDKTLKLLPVKVSKTETNVLASIFKIADKIDYKVLTLNDMKVKVSDKKLKEFWQTRKNNFMSDVIYTVVYIKQAPVAKTYDTKKITEYYQNNKTHFKDKEGKILSLKAAKSKIIEELNKKATKDQALRKYVAFKKEKLNASVVQKEANISLSKNPFNANVLTELSKRSLAAPYMKPMAVEDSYYIFKLTKITPAKPKSFEEAKQELTPLYIQEMKKKMLAKLAANSVKNFKGQKTDFITVNAVDKLKKLSKEEASEFLQKLFMSDKKVSFISLKDGNIILYKILEQKMLPSTDVKLNGEMSKLKNTMFNEGLIKKLQNKYKTEIYIKGL